MVKPIPTLKKSVNNATAIPAAMAQAFVETSRFPEEAPAQPTVTESVAVSDGAVASAPSNDNLVSLHGPKSAEGAKPAATATPKTSKSRRAVMTRADGAVVRKTTVYLSPELDRRLSLHALDTGTDRSEIVGAALERYLRTKE